VDSSSSLEFKALGVSFPSILVSYSSLSKTDCVGEISPPAFRASFGGLAYQLGNMASSAAAQIEATAGESLKLKGTNIPDYVRPSLLYSRAS
jgi:hypothetical protein